MTYLERIIYLSAIADGECSVLYPGKAWIAEDGWIVSLISPADLAQLDKMEE